MSPPDFAVGQIRSTTLQLLPPFFQTFLRLRLLDDALAQLNGLLAVSNLASSIRHKTRLMRSILHSKENWQRIVRALGIAGMQRGPITFKKQSRHKLTQMLVHHQFRKLGLYHKVHK